MPFEPVSNADRHKYFDILCTEIATSNKGVATICKEMKESEGYFPTERAIFKWILEDSALKEKYETAKAFQTEVFVDEMIQISDYKGGDYYETEQGIKLDKESVLRSRLKIETRKWVAVHLLPHKYGNNMDLRVSQLEAMLVEQNKQITRLLAEHNQK